MTQQHETHDDWSPCPPGTLTNLAGRLKDQHRSRQRKKIAAAAAAMLAMAWGVTLWFATQPSVDSNGYGGVSCVDVRSFLPQMAAGTISEEVRSKVEIHLTKCPACAELARRIQITQTSPSDPRAENGAGLNGTVVALSRFR